MVCYKEKSGDRGRGNEVMTASVTNVWQCVILGIERNDCSAVTVFSLERSFDTESMACDFISEAGKSIADGIMGSMFGVG
jgi:hypothetical protein